MDETYIELKFRPNIELISVVRRFVAEAYERTVTDAEAASRIGLATHELLENGVKYSTNGETTLRLVIADTPPAKTVSIRTWNRAAPARIESLKRIFDEMNAAPDAFAYYQMIMRRNAKSTGESGLGLARVRAEGEMTMSYEVQGDEVLIIAETRVQARSTV